MLLMVALYLSATNLRLIFMVGVISFLSTENSSGSRVNSFAVDGLVQLDAKNSLRGAVRYLETAEKDISGEDELGTELDTWYAYKYNQNLTLKLEGAYLFSGDLAEVIFENYDDVCQIGTGMEFAFY